MSITTEFLRRPLMTGAVASSSRRLAYAMTEGIGLEQARTVAELGPGTGVFTDAILARLASGARLVAVELNPVLAARLTATRRDRRLTVVQGWGGGRGPPGGVTATRGGGAGARGRS
ncbi:rRNA adenine N-6-methyltransferase family protein, partial [Streptomyces sp. NPDC059627]